MGRASFRVPRSRHCAAVFAVSCWGNMPQSAVFTGEANARSCEVLQAKDVVIFTKRCFLRHILKMKDTEVRWVKKNPLFQYFSTYLLSLRVWGWWLFVGLDLAKMQKRTKTCLGLKKCHSRIRRECVNGPHYPGRTLSLIQCGQSNASLKNKKKL